MSSITKNKIVASLVILHMLALLFCVCTAYGTTIFWRIKEAGLAGNADLWEKFTTLTMFAAILCWLTCSAVSMLGLKMEKYGSSREKIFWIVLAVVGPPLEFLLIQIMNPLTPS